MVDNSAQYKRQLNQTRQQEKKKREALLEIEIAEQYKKGAPMGKPERPLEAGTFTGGGTAEGKEGVTPEVPTKKEKKSEAPPTYPAQPPAGAQATPAAAAAPGGRLAETEQLKQGPKTRADLAKEAIEGKKEDIAKTQARLKEAEEKREETRGLSRIIRERKLKAQKKALARKQEELGALQRILGAQQGSATALRAAWLNLIPSFGVSWFYIAFHALMAYFTPFSHLFCKFGEEWLPKQARAAGGEAAKRASKGLEIIEWLGCVFIGIIILLIILGIVVFISLIVWAVTHPGSVVKAIISEAIRNAWCNIFGCPD